MLNDRAPSNVMINAARFLYLKRLAASRLISEGCPFIMTVGVWNLAGFLQWLLGTRRCNIRTAQQNTFHGS